MAVVLGSDPDVVAVGSAALGRGNAVDAVVAAVFGAAGLYPSVLLGPVHLLIGGAGAGLQAIDGRVRQPGLGNPRPRGFLPNEAIPGAARVGAPGLPAALLAAVTTYGKFSVAAVVGPGLEIARGRSKARGAVLERIAQRGPAALAEAGLSEELTAVAGRLSGGLLSVRDLDELRPEVSPPTLQRGAGRREFATVPWGATSVRKPGEGTVFAGETRLVVAADKNGLLAIACYEVANTGLTFDAFDLVAPFAAAPVMRGETRVQPGSPRASAAPIALAQTGGLLDLAAGIGGSAEAEAELGTWISTYEPASTLERTAPLPTGLAGVQRAGSSWATFRE